MCRLFGMSGGPRAVPATFWLVDAPDSLAAQSVRERDGTGLGWFDDGVPRLAKEPLEADRDPTFLRDARTVVSRTFVAHVRWAYTGAIAPENTQPFAGDGVLFAHQGLVLELGRIDERLGADRAIVGGETDSERIFALIRREARERSGDWDAQTLHLLERHEPAGTCACGGSCLCVRFRPPAVVLASERLDGEEGWQPLRSAELVHVDSELNVAREVVVDREPARRLTLADLNLPEGVQA